MLLLRGPQTPGELKSRGERLHHFEDLVVLQETLNRLEARGLVRSIGRRPGQKEERWQHMLGESEPIDLPAAAPYQEDSPPASRAALAAAADDEVGRAGTGAARIAALEAEVRVLRDEVDALRRDLGLARD